MPNDIGDATPSELAPTTDFGHVTMTRLQTEEQLQQSMPGTSVVQKVAIVKALPISYPKEAWKQMAPAFANVTFAMIIDAVQKVADFQFSPWVWDVIIATVGGACLMLSANFVWVMHRRKKNSDTVTQKLMELYGDPKKYAVQLIECDQEVINVYTLMGYKIVTR